VIGNVRLASGKWVQGFFEEVGVQGAQEITSFGDGAGIWLALIAAGDRSEPTAELVGLAKTVQAIH
jgi:hypothetical protein